MIGSVLNHYEVLEKLGEGGMGHVYLAEDTRLHRRVALKVLPAEMAADSRKIERFEREARAVAALNHPNIVTLFSVEEAGGVHFLTMEHVDGDSLDDRILFGGLQLGEFFDIALPLVSAVASAHRKGITHRDIKPANVMINSEGVVKLLDLGLAKLKLAESDDRAGGGYETLTQEGRVIGTVPYMAPEQLSARPSDHRVDVFALGVVFYQMLTGIRPFQGDSSNELISSILRDQPTPLREVRGALPQQLEALIHRCLEKDPVDRFQTAAELHDELEVQRRLFESAEAASPFSTIRQRPAPTGQRHQWLVVVGLVLMVAILAGTIFSLVSPPPQPESQSRGTPTLLDLVPGSSGGAVPEEPPLIFPAQPPPPETPPERTTTALPAVQPSVPDPLAAPTKSVAPAVATSRQALIRIESAVPGGVVTLYADALQIYRRTFQFSERKRGVLGRIGLRRRTGGELEDTFTLPEGIETLRLYVSLRDQPARTYEVVGLRGDGSDRLIVSVESARQVRVGLNGTAVIEQP